MMRKSHLSMTLQATYFSFTRLSMPIAMTCIGYIAGKVVGVDPKASAIFLGLSSLIVKITKPIFTNINRKLNKEEKAEVTKSFKIILISVCWCTSFQITRIFSRTFTLAKALKVAMAAQLVHNIVASSY